MCVVDQEKALRFYTEVLGFVKKADFSQRRFAGSRWPHQRNRTARRCSRALNDNPAAKAYQQAMFQQGQPAAMFYTDDVVNFGSRRLQ